MACSTDTYTLSLYCLSCHEDATIKITDDRKNKYRHCYRTLTYDYECPTCRLSSSFSYVDKVLNKQGGEPMANKRLPFAYLAHLWETAECPFNMGVENHNKRFMDGLMALYAELRRKDWKR